MRMLNAGRPWLTTGEPELVTGPGVQIVEKGTGMANAPADGTYSDGRGRYRVRKGQPYPEGAAFTPTEAAEPESEERAKPAPKENRKKQAAPENRAAEDSK